MIAPARLCWIPLLTGLLILSACDSAQQNQAVAAADFDAQTSCSLDGMLLSEYPGPKAQIYYDGEDKPVYFCDTVELFHTLLQPEQIKRIRSIFVQDMAKTEWDKPIGHWTDARNAFYVSGSKRNGSMGPTLGSFALETDAVAFTKQYGGKVLKFADIHADMVDLSGGALHDSKM